MKIQKKDEIWVYLLKRHVESIIQQHEVTNLEVFYFDILQLIYMKIFSMTSLQSHRRTTSFSWITLRGLRITLGFTLMCLVELIIFLIIWLPWEQLFILYFRVVMFRWIMTIMMMVDKSSDFDNVKGEQSKYQEHHQRVKNKLNQKARNS